MYFRLLFSRFKIHATKHRYSLKAWNCAQEADIWSQHLEIFHHQPVQHLWPGEPRTRSIAAITSGRWGLDSTPTTEELYGNRDPDQDLALVTPPVLVELCWGYLQNKWFSGFWYGFTKALMQLRKRKKNCSTAVSSCKNNINRGFFKCKVNGWAMPIFLHFVLRCLEELTRKYAINCATLSSF